jgi:hypothetical protein
MHNMISLLLSGHPVSSLQTFSLGQLAAFRHWLCLFNLADREIISPKSIGLD